MLLSTLLLYFIDKSFSCLEKYALCSRKIGKFVVHCWKGAPNFTEHQQSSKNFACGGQFPVQYFIVTTYPKPGKVCAPRKLKNCVTLLVRCRKCDPMSKILKIFRLLRAVWLYSSSTLEKYSKCDRRSRILEIFRLRRASYEYKVYNCIEKFVSPSKIRKFMLQILKLSACGGHGSRYNNICSGDIYIGGHLLN